MRYCNIISLHFLCMRATILCATVAVARTQNNTVTTPDPENFNGTCTENNPIIGQTITVTCTLQNLTGYTLDAIRIYKHLGNTESHLRYEWQQNGTHQINKSLGNFEGRSALDVTQNADNFILTLFRVDQCLWGLYYAIVTWTPNNTQKRIEFYVEYSWPNGFEMSTNSCSGDAVQEKGTNVTISCHLPSFVPDHFYLSRIKVFVGSNPTPQFGISYYNWYRGNATTIAPVFGKGSLSLSSHHLNFTIFNIEECQIDTNRQHSISGSGHHYQILVFYDMEGSTCSQTETMISGWLLQPRLIVPAFLDSKIQYRTALSENWIDFDDNSTLEIDQKTDLFIRCLAKGVHPRPAVHLKRSDMAYPGNTLESDRLRFQYQSCEDLEDIFVVTDISAQFRNTQSPEAYTGNITYQCIVKGDQIPNGNVTKSAIIQYVKRLTTLDVTSSTSTASTIQTHRTKITPKYTTAVRKKSGCCNLHISYIRLVLLCAPVLSLMKLRELCSL